MNVADHVDRLTTLLDERGPDAAFDAAVELPAAVATEVLETLVSTRPGAEGIEVPKDRSNVEEWPFRVAGLMYELTWEALASREIQSRVSALCGELLAFRQGKQGSQRAAFDAVMGGHVADTEKYLPEGTTPDSVDAEIRLRESKLAIAAACVDPETRMADIVMAIVKEAERDGKAKMVGGDTLAVEASMALGDIRRHAHELMALYRQRCRDLGCELPDNDQSLSGFRIGVSLGVGLAIHGPAENRRRAVATLENVITGVEQKGGG